MIKPQHLSRISLTLLGFCVLTVVTMSAQTLATLVKFNGTNGGQPESSLLQAPDGNFYGTTSPGGTNGGGAVFKMTPAGKLTALYNFCSLTDCNDGATAGQLVLASDGNAYGFTVIGGANCHDLADIGCGTIFKLTPQKTLVTLYSFCVQTDCNRRMEPRLADPGERWKFLRDDLPCWPQRRRRGFQNHSRRCIYSSIRLSGGRAA